jgi:hypothetical protein
MAKNWKHSNVQQLMNAKQNNKHMEYDSTIKRNEGMGVVA